MRLKTTIATLACGLLMMYGGIGCKDNIFTKQELTEGKDIIYATELFDKNICASLRYLKSALGEDVPKNYDSNEIIRTTEEVIDKYSKKAYCRDVLLGLAKEADKYERKETAGDILKKELDDLDERDCSDSFKYHLWMVYRIEQGKTDSIGATHKNLKDFYKKNDLVNYDTVTHVFGQIERKFPENNSRFEDMVIQKNNFGQIFSKLL